MYGEERRRWGVAGLIRTGSRGFHPRLVYRVKSHLSGKKQLGSLSSLNHLPHQIFIYDFMPRDPRCGRPYRRPDQSTAPKKKNTHSSGADDVTSISKAEEKKYSFYLVGC
jgi:hypothetical protein